MIKLDEYYIKLISGKLRTGKGVLATREALKELNAGKKVLSNYTIKHKNASKIDFFELLSLLEKPRQNPPVTIVLDEVQGWLDSYVGQSHSGRIGSYFVFQSAKLGYNMIITSQIIMRAFNTLRLLATHRYRANVDRKKKCFYYYILNPNNPDEDELTGCGFTISFEEASTFWDLYDTYEPVKPLGIDTIKADLLKHDPKKMMDFVSYQANIVTKLIDKEGIKLRLTESLVKYLLLRLYQPTVFSKYVFLDILLNTDRKRKSLKENLLSHKELQKNLLSNGKLPLQEWNKLLLSQ